MSMLREDWAPAAIGESEGTTGEPSAPSGEDEGARGGRGRQSAKAVAQGGRLHFMVMVEAQGRSN